MEDVWRMRASAPRSSNGDGALRAARSVRRLAEAVTRALAVIVFLGACGSNRSDNDATSSPARASSGESGTSDAGELSGSAGQSSDASSAEDPVGGSTSVGASGDGAGGNDASAGASGSGTT